LNHCKMESSRRCTRLGRYQIGSDRHSKNCNVVRTEGLNR
jgi:hypothetical protein